MINFIKEVYIKSFRALRDVKYDNIGLINEVYGKMVVVKQLLLKH